MAESKRVIIAGGSGFLGRELIPFLQGHGHAVEILSRTPNPAADVPWHVWDNKTLGTWAERLDGAAGVINLVGRSVDCLKTPENCREIMASRVDSCRVLGEAMRAVKRPPPVWIQSGTAHIIGDPVPNDTVCDESTSPPAFGLAPKVGVAWERAFHEARLPGQRGVVFRTSFVLGAGGGAMRKLITMTRLGLGGTIGSGRQWISWLHQTDFNRLTRAAIRDDAYEGTYMVTAPMPVTNREFMRAMRKAYGRPWSPPAPVWAVRLAARWVLKTDPELALLGRRCVPTRLLNEHAFAFEFADIDRATRAVAGR